MVEFNGWFFVLVANFLILLLVLNAVLFKPVLGLIKERHNIRYGSLDEVRALEKKKEQAIEQLKTEMAAAHANAKEIFTRIREKGIIRQHELIAISQDKAVSSFYNATKELTKEVEQVTADIMRDLDKYADEVVGKLTHGYVKNN
ncbi:MAG: ATP synthase F0 subunit B [Nitrospirota bacterium]|uniref:ATP synthase F0 subunit B n=1 Tax=Candidatus Magnetominusculus xianensis TaxID=1748249 RepID=A0ABR5SDB5_9BACT|nr:ATP synthase F0 subunit B [Candidatus Magnetominusculus xianensis]KWT78218.1 ATP synthase F0 subunit B' [Candidatus Magnetominusculus xianensis]MBF0402830.1 ATP synthase F0 subunit B [Nitrospirota bacterium]